MITPKMQHTVFSMVLDYVFDSLIQKDKRLIVTAAF